MRIMYMVVLGGFVCVVLIHFGWFSFVLCALGVVLRCCVGSDWVFHSLCGFAERCVIFRCGLGCLGVRWMGVRASRMERLEY